jgi:hypothetical protein
LIPGRGNDGIFSLITASRRALGPTQPPKQWALGALLPNIMQLEREANNPPPLSVMFKNVWSYTSTPHTSAWCGDLLSKKTTLPYFKRCVQLYTKVTAECAPDLTLVSQVALTSQKGHIMWVPVTTNWCILRLQMEKMASRYRG